jgi:hypothetical protein
LGSADLTEEEQQIPKTETQPRILKRELKEEPQTSKAEVCATLLSYTADNFD